MQQISIDFMQLLLLLGSFAGFCILACAAVGKTLLMQTQKSLDQRFAIISEHLDDIEKTGHEEALQWKQIERELMTLKADLPLLYVRREDYIRGQSVIEAKLDGLADKLENAQLRGLLGVKTNVN